MILFFGMVGGGSAFIKCADEEEAKLYIKAVKNAGPGDWIIGPDNHDGKPVHIKASDICILHALDESDIGQGPKIQTPKLVIPGGGRTN